jgi:protein-glutamine gamma-glutamyltransferase
MVSPIRSRARRDTATRSRQSGGRANWWRGRKSRDWLVASLSTAVYGLGAIGLAFPVASPVAAVAAGIGAALGALAACRLARSSFRLSAILAASALAVLVASAAHAAAVNVPWFAHGLGPALAMRWADSVLAGSSALVLATALRTSVMRARLFSIVEVALVSIAFAELVVAHREGAINRPFELADPMIAMGIDPTIALLAIGAAAALVIVLVLLSERSLVRLVIHLGVALAMVVSIFFAARVVGLPQPAPDSLGLRTGQADQRDHKPGREAKPNDGGGRRSNDELDFRDNYRSSFNRAPIAVVLLHDDYSPPSGVYYFRQSAFSLYNGRRLVEAGADLDRDLAVSFPTSRVAISDVPNQRGDRAVVDTTVALLADHKRPFALESPLSLEPAFNPDPARFRRIYRVSSASLTSDYYALLGVPAGEPTWTSETWRAYNRGPADPRYHELARKIIDGLRLELRDDPMARALSVSSWLSKEGVYSLRSGHAAAADPTADFLFGDKTGYCVHFAHAAVYLMRSLGLPARIATGYVIDEAARRGGSTIVLSGENSHSWPELYLEGVGWVVVDIVPERSLDPPPPPPDADLQRLLGELARAEKPLPYPGTRLFEPAARMALEIAKTLGWVILAVLGLGLGSAYLIKLWRRLAPLLVSRRHLARLLYRAQLDRLSELRLRRAFGESREGFAARTALLCPSFIHLTQAHLYAAFAQQPSIEAHWFKECSRRIKTELETAIPWWRRFFGALIPWSWLGSR